MWFLCSKGRKNLIGDAKKLFFKVSSMSGIHLGLFDLEALSSCYLQEALHMTAIIATVGFATRSMS